MTEAPTWSSWSRYAARTEGLIRNTTWLRMSYTVENNTVRVYCFWAVRANQASSWSAPKTRSSVPRTITDMGLFSTKRANTLPRMVASSSECVSKACSVTNREREGHLNRAGPWGNYHYRSGCKRSWCNGCKRTFNDLTNTLLHQSQRSLPHWILATFLLCLACSSRRIAREVGVHIRTSYRWCWWLRNAALSYEMHRQLEGTVEADDLYHTAGQKGQAKTGGKKSLGRHPRS